MYYDPLTVLLVMLYQIMPCQINCINRGCVAARPKILKILMQVREPLHRRGVLVALLRTG